MPHFYPDDHFALPAQEYLEIVLEQSKKQLIKMRVQLREKPEELEVKERNFLRRECAKLDILATLHVQLDAYRKLNQNTSAEDKEKEAQQFSNSEKLGKHLRAVGHFKPGVNWQAHHLICSKHKSHLSARLKLFAYMGINDPCNGCWLPEKHVDASNTIYPFAVGHVYLHTQKYAKWIFNEVRKVNSTSEMRNRLRLIRLKLLSAKKEQKILELLSSRGQQDMQNTAKPKKA